MPDESDDFPALLQAVRRRDEAAARSLVERLYPLVRRIVGAHRPWRIDAEDLVQEVFMSVFADIGQYRGAVPFEHWVARIAVTTCLDTLRREKCRPELRWADLSEEEVAELTGWGRSRVKVRAFRARQHMRRALEKLLQESKP